jgi:hypothetical protein
MFQDEAPLLRAYAHPAFADTWTAAVNLVVVASDGSRPDRPDYLRGGGQARRHRAACNRGHGLLRGCVEFRNDRDASRTSNPAIIAGISTANKPGAGACNFDLRDSVGGSASGSGPRVGEWLCNHLCLVLVHDISDLHAQRHRDPERTSTRSDQRIRRQPSEEGPMGSIRAAYAAARA